MKRLLLLVLLGLSLAYCKDKNDPEPLSEISGIVGTWRMVEYRYQDGDSIVIKDMTNEEQKVFSIRFDGVMLYDGYASCCAPREYNVNGKDFEVNPLKDVPQDESCLYVNCWVCPKVDIIQSGDEMTIVSCNSRISKYVRGN